MDKIRFKCVVAYDGTKFRGWQSQTGGKTVQDFIEAKLEKILKSPTRIHASGRTDAGVHAKAQVIHFDAHWKHSAQKLLTALRSGDFCGVQLMRLTRAKNDFHARYSAKGKRYVYYIHLGLPLPHEAPYVWTFPRSLDTKKMSDAAKILIGEHDFTAFSGNRGAKDNPVKTLRKLDIAKRGKRIKITTEGSGYMYKMVRMLVGALTDIGSGKLTNADIKNHLDNRKRTNLIQPAPACGLFLEKVFY